MTRFTNIAALFGLSCVCLLAAMPSPAAAQGSSMFNSGQLQKLLGSSGMSGLSGMSGMGGLGGMSGGMGGGTSGMSGFGSTGGGMGGGGMGGGFGGGGMGGGGMGGGGMGGGGMSGGGMGGMGGMGGGAGANGMNQGNFVGRNMNANQFIGGNGMVGAAGGQLGGNRQGLGGLGNRGGQNAMQNFNQNPNGAQQHQAPQLRARQRIAFDYQKPQAQVLHTQVETRFSKLTERNIAMKGVNLATERSGTVVLRGEVASESAAKLAERLVRLEPGVKSVRSELTFPAAVAAQAE